MKKVITLFSMFCLPSFVLRPVLRLFGYKIGRNVKIGFSFFYLDKIELGNDVKIGNLNIFLNKGVFLESCSKIGYLNIFKGPFSINLSKNAAVGNKNYMTRGGAGITYGDSNLTLGTYTKITTGHHLDLTQSITFGEYSILAGIRSQIWTHGYYHSDQGKDRIRIDGALDVGNNVYIGSGCIFNPGVTITNAIHIGSGSVISKNLTKKGMYVGQGLRFIENNIEGIKSKLEEVTNVELIEKVYCKKNKFNVTNENN